MTQKKQKKRLRVGALAAAVILAALALAGVTANAATDGALFSGVKLILSGEEINLKEYIAHYDTYTTSDGGVVEKYEAWLPEGVTAVVENEYHPEEGYQSGKVEVQMDGGEDQKVVVQADTAINVD